jgi:hypothetical protein
LELLLFIKYLGLYETSYILQLFKNSVLSDKINWDSRVIIVTRLGTGKSGFDLCQGQRVSLPPNPDQFWGLPSLLSSGCHRALCQEEAGNRKVTTLLHLMLTLRIYEAISPFPHVSSWHGA